MNDLRLFMENYTNVSNDEWAVISSKLVSLSFNRNEIILKESEVCRHLYFLQSGLLRYFINSDGNEVTKFFTDAPYLFTSQISFSKSKPATESIQAIENCNVLALSYADAHDLLVLPCWSEFIRKLIQEVQAYTEQILIEMQTTLAEERYIRLLQTNAQLVQRIPLKYIASYLGIAPQSLSRIRKQLVKPKSKLT